MTTQFKFEIDQEKKRSFYHKKTNLKKSRGKREQVVSVEHKGAGCGKSIKYSRGSSMKLQM